ncbi:MAG: sulfite exporter TauE/SafE family protein [Flavobacteriales bacterium]|nr:sulfite exporter TauE/SafE family protein [Flavobacteriales bacterium]
MNTMLATAFVLGVAGSAHCVGMCGPIALAVPSPRNTFGSRLTSSLLLNTGRLMSYAFLGAAIGVFGAGMRLAGLQQVVSMAAGVLLLLTVMLPGLLERWSPTGRIAMVIGRLRHLLARNLARTAPETLFFTGVLNGLLPCGLVYAALIGTSAMSSPLEGSVFMALFALGTWPTLIALRMSAGLVGARVRERLRSISPLLVTLVAVLMILRGMELGIPYVSPAAAITPVEVTACH